MNNMQPTEEQLITGSILASWRISGQPTVGDVLTFGVVDPTAGLEQVPYTVQQSDFDLPTDPVNPPQSSPLYSIALNSTVAINQAIAALGYAAIAVMPADLFAPSFMPPYFAEVILTANQSALGSYFSIAATGGSTTNLLVEQQATPSPVNATLTNYVTGNQETVFGMIPLCDALAMGMTQQGLSLWLTKADVVQFRQNERRARIALYRYYTDELAKMLGGQEYVRKFGGAGAGGGGASC